MQQKDEKKEKRKKGFLLDPVRPHSNYFMTGEMDWSMSFLKTVFLCLNNWPTEIIYFDKMKINIRNVQTTIMLIQHVAPNPPWEVK